MGHFARGVACALLATALLAVGSQAWGGRLPPPAPSAPPRVAVPVAPVGALEAVEDDPGEPPMEYRPLAPLPVVDALAADVVEIVATDDDATLTPAAEVKADAPSGDDLAKRVKSLEEKLKKADDAKKAADAKAAADKQSAEGWTDLSSEKWTVKLGGHVQGDFVHFANAEAPPIPAQDYFEFRRLRLLADVAGYGVFDGRLQIDIEPEGEDNVTTPVVTVKDAYLTMHEVTWLQRIRVGNFFVPFSLEQVTNDTNNIFLERSIPTQGVFAADREVGFAAYGINDAKNFTWTTGVFIDSISEALKERIDDNQGHRLSGRLTWLPYYDEPSKGRYLVHTGVGILHTEDQDRIIRFSARPQIHEGPRFIDTGNRPGAGTTSANLEFATVWGSASVQSELFVTNADLFAGDANLYGGYVYASYFLTGENRNYERFGQHGAQFGRNVPNTNFFAVPGCFGSGAWEAKARMSYLDLGEVGSGRYHDVTLGFNWYWTDRIRMMFDYIHPMTSEETTFGSTDSDIVAMRFDFNF